MSAVPLQKYYEAVSQDGPVGEDEAIVVINTDRVDRDREVVVPTGGRFDDYSRNRVVMFGHAKGMPSEGEAAFPIARNVWIKPTSDGKGLVARHKFDMEDEFAAKTCRKIKKDFLSSHSVKFLPIRWGPPTRAEIQKNPSWADAKTVYREWSLLEYSVLVFPANPDAITLVKGANKMAESTETIPLSFAKDLNEEARTFVASQEEASEMIARSCVGDTIFKGFLATAEQKGEKLGDLRNVMLRPIVDALCNCMNGYLWGCVYDYRDEPGSYSDRIGAACGEFCEAAITAFESFEPLRVKTEKSLEMQALAKSMSFEAIDLFGDPAEILRESLTKAITPEVKEAGDEEEAGEKSAKAVKESTDEDGEEDEGPAIKPGDHVKCKAPHVRGCGKVMSVHTKEMVPDVEDDVMGSGGMPAVRVKMYKRMGDGWQPTAVHRGVLMSHCEKCGPLKPPSKAKGVAETDPPPEPSWNDQQMAVAVEMYRSTPEFKKELHQAVLDRLAVELGRV